MVAIAFSISRSVQKSGWSTMTKPGFAAEHGSDEKRVRVLCGMYQYCGDESSQDKGDVASSTVQLRLPKYLQTSSTSPAIT